MTFLIQISTESNEAPLQGLQVLSFVQKWLKVKSSNILSIYAMHGRNYTLWSTEVRNTGSSADACTCDNNSMFAVTDPCSKLRRLLINDMSIIVHFWHATATFVLVRRQARSIVDGHIPT